MLITFTHYIHKVVPEKKKNTIIGIFNAHYGMIIVP